MSEWKQNERRTSGFPEGIEEGMVLDVKFRNGDIERRTVGYQEGSDLDWLSTAHFNTNDGYSVDVMAYRVVGETAAAPAIPPKTAIELQAEEVGIPEPVRLVDDDTHLGIKRPDGDGWVKYNAGDVVDLDGVVSIDWADAIGYNMTCPEPKELRWADNETDQIAWYRLNYGDASQHYTSEQLAAEADKLIDDAAQSLREAFGGKVATTEPVTAPEFLQSALNTLTQRGKDYDKPEGERSAAAVSVAFNAITGRNLTEAEVWLVLQLVKDVRQWQNPGRYHADSALDCVAYAALKAEALAGSGK